MIEQRFEVFIYDEVTEKIRALLAEGWLVKTLSVDQGGVEQERLAQVFVVLERASQEETEAMQRVIEEAYESNIRPIQQLLAEDLDLVALGVAIH